MHGLCLPLQSVNNFLSLFNTYIQVFFQGMITHTSAYVNSPDEVLEQFRLNNLKIFIGYFGPQDAREVLCKVRGLPLISVN